MVQPQWQQIMGDREQPVYKHEANLLHRPNLSQLCSVESQKHLLREITRPARTRLKPRWMEERKFIMLAGQHLDISKIVLQNRWLGFLYPERRQQASREYRSRLGS
jgi:hypothetical protein